MIVVADTSPLNYLVLINEIEILPLLYGVVLVPQSVYEELASPLAPKDVREWISHRGTWLEIRTPGILADSSLAGLDRGETDAIRLAQEHQATERTATIANAKAKMPASRNVGASPLRGAGQRRPLQQQKRQRLGCG